MSGLLELATMSKIQILSNELLSEEDQKKFEEIMPHLCTEDPIRIATPYTIFYPTEKIWELEAKVRTYDGVTSIYA